MMPTTDNRQPATGFDAFEQIDALLGEMRAAADGVRRDVDRLERLTQRAAAGLAELRRERERLDIYTEDEAAAVLRIDPTMLQKMRLRGGGVPHRMFGTKIRYTRGDIDAILEMLAVGGGGKVGSGRKAAGSVLRAA